MYTFSFGRQRASIMLETSGEEANLSDEKDSKRAESDDPSTRPVESLNVE